MDGKWEVRDSDNKVVVKHVVHANVVGGMDEVCVEELIVKHET